MNSSERKIRVQTNAVFTLTFVHRIEYILVCALDSPGWPVGQSNPTEPLASESMATSLPMSAVADVDK
jgi:hypothetical protein